MEEDKIINFILTTSFQLKVTILSIGERKEGVRFLSTSFLPPLPAFKKRRIKKCIQERKN